MVNNCFMNRICSVNLIFTCKKIYFETFLCITYILQFWKQKIKKGDAYNTQVIVLFEWNIYIYISYF
jgi:hypothetical protein